eukprot:IDg9036t1
MNTSSLNRTFSAPKETLNLTGAVLIFWHGSQRMQRSSNIRSVSGLVHQVSLGEGDLRASAPMSGRTGGEALTAVHERFITVSGTRLSRSRHPFLGEQGTSAETMSKSTKMEGAPLGVQSDNTRSSSLFPITEDGAPMSTQNLDGRLVLSWRTSDAAKMFVKLTSSHIVCASGGSLTRMISVVSHCRCK